MVFKGRQKISHDRERKRGPAPIFGGKEKIPCYDGTASANHQRGGREE